LFHCVNQIEISKYCFLKVEKVLKGSLDLIPSPSTTVKIQIMAVKFCLRCKGKTLFVDITQQCFALLPQVNFPANNFEFSLKLKVMGSNPGYILKSFLLY